MHMLANGDSLQNREIITTQTLQSVVHVTGNSIDFLLANFASTAKRSRYGASLLPLRT